MITRDIRVNGQDGDTLMIDRRDCGMMTDPDGIHDGAMSDAAGCGARTMNAVMQKRDWNGCGEQ